MPMSFPTFESLRFRAESRGFRQPINDETEEVYRENFARFMRHVDQVESSEIRSGRGWDNQLPEELLLNILAPQKDTGIYLHTLHTVDLTALPKNLVTGLFLGQDERGRQRFQFTELFEDENDQYSKYNCPEGKKLLPAIEIPYSITQVACHPKKIQNIHYIEIGGVYINAIRIHECREVVSVNDCIKLEVPSDKVFFVIKYFATAPLPA